MSWKKLRENIRKQRARSAQRIRSALYPVTKTVGFKRPSKPESERPLQEIFMRSKMGTRRKKPITLPKIRFIDDDK
jgi:hypothetical protein